MLNRIILIGRLTRDPEAKYTPSGVPTTSFSIAVDRPQSSESRQQGREKETDFIDIVTWRQTAEFAGNYLQKGRLVVVEGKLQIRSYVTQDGQQRKAAEVVADNIRALDRAREGDEGGDNGGGAYGRTQVANPPPRMQGARQAPPQRPAPQGANRGHGGQNDAARSYRRGTDEPDDDLSDPFAE
jgi:single-strand DNA-binding protein